MDFFTSILIVVIVAISILAYTLYSYSAYYLLHIQIAIVFIANSPWALIPEVITSRFPKYFGFLAGSIDYNEGLIISFASPNLFNIVIMREYVWSSLKKDESSLRVKVAIYIHEIDFANHIKRFKTF